MGLKEINPLWRLSDPLTVQQAAALIAGFDPVSVRFNSLNEAWFEGETGLMDSDGILWVQVAFLSLVNAINAGNLPATIRSKRVQEWDAKYGGIKEVDEPTPDWRETKVTVSDLVAWMKAANICTGFFFPELTDAPDYLDPNNPRYAPKLAAAVKVWQAMEDENLLRGKGAISAMEQWLESRYKELGLTHGQGSEKHGYKAGDINKTAIEEVAKVANWRTSGGAAKTPGG